MGFEGGDVLDDGAVEDYLRAPGGENLQDPLAIADVEQEDLVVVQ